MKTGWYSNGNHEEPGTGDNVVRFPGDWFGPREELVPFEARPSEDDPGADLDPYVSRLRPHPGERPPSLTEDLHPPSEDLHPPSAEPSHASRGGGLPSPTADELLPPTAEDFWGQGSAAIHHPLPGPERPSPGKRAARGGLRITLPLHLDRVSRVAIPVALLLMMAMTGYVLGAPGAHKHPLEPDAQVHEGTRGASRRGAVDLQLDLRPPVRIAQAAALHRPRPTPSRSSVAEQAPVAVASASSIPQVTATPASDISRTSEPTSPSQPDTRQYAASGPSTAQASRATASTSPPAGPVGPGAAFGPGEMK